MSDLFFWWSVHVNSSILIPAQLPRLLNQDWRSESSSMRKQHLAILETSSYLSSGLWPWLETDMNPCNFGHISKHTWQQLALLEVESCAVGCKTFSPPQDCSENFSHSPIRSSEILNKVQLRSCTWLANWDYLLVGECDKISLDFCNLVADFRILWDEWLVIEFRVCVIQIIIVFIDLIHSSADKSLMIIISREKSLAKLERSLKTFPTWYKHCVPPFYTVQSVFKSASLWFAHNHDALWKYSSLKSLFQLEKFACSLPLTSGLCSARPVSTCK